MSISDYLTPEERAGADSINLPSGRALRQARFDEISRTIVTLMVTRSGAMWTTKSEYDAIVAKMADIGGAWVSDAVRAVEAYVTGGDRHELILLIEGGSETWWDIPMNETTTLRDATIADLLAPDDK